MKVRLDRKGKPVSYIGVEEARYLIEYARSQSKDPEYSIMGEAAHPFAPYIRLVGDGSAQVLRKPVWVRTSFRVRKEVWREYQQLAKENGLDACEGLRIQMENALDLWKNGESRRTLRNYVG